MGLSVESFLIEPVQRVPRYRLLLESLLKSTPEDHAEHESISEALALVMEIAQANNDAIKARENKQKIMEIMCLLTSASRINLLDEPSRLLLKEGVLMRQCRRSIKEFIFWLFTDKLLYAEKSASGFYILHREILLSSCRVNKAEIEPEISSSPQSTRQGFLSSFLFSSPSSSKSVEGGKGKGGGEEAEAFKGEHRSALFLESSSKSFLAFAETESERDNWVNAIQMAIDELRVRQEQESGEIAPLWTPDAAVLTCQKCHVAFSLIVRRHHCRSCGAALCDVCSNNKCMVSHVDADREVRVCVECFEKRTQWVADSHAQSCHLCELAFNTFTRRKHHCRVCGNCVCDSCSKHRALIPEIDATREVRVCKSCINLSPVKGGGNSKHSS